MAWVRQLPSGRYAATVRLPTGKRVTQTFLLRGLAKAWADGLETDGRRGEWIDPRAGEVTVGQWWERTKNSRRLEYASRKRDESHWRVHVSPRWSTVPVGTIVRPDVTAWVVAMEANKVGAATIQGAVGVLRGLLDLAVDAQLRRDNPAKGVRMPKRNAHVDRVLSYAEEDRLLEALPDKHRLFVRLLLHGLRWEEAAGLDREHVDLRRGLIHVGPVLERDGTIRPYPKSKAGIRDVPVDEDVWPSLRAYALTVHPDSTAARRGAGGNLWQSEPSQREDASRGLLFPRMHYSNWLRRVWNPAVARAELDDPQPTPHDLRHTYGTRLGEARMPAHEIMALMGHSSLAAAQRYLHAGEDRFDRARQAMKRARGM